MADPTTPAPTFTAAIRQALTDEVLADAYRARNQAFDANIGEVRDMPHVAHAYGWRAMRDVLVDALAASLVRREADIAELRSTLYAWTVDSVTAGANPQKDGTMSPPLYHVSCKLCGTRWSVTMWDRNAAEKMHPPSDCINAPAKPTEAP